MNHPTELVKVDVALSRKSGCRLTPRKLADGEMSQEALENKIRELTAWWEDRPVERFERVAVETDDLLSTER